jgi:hypothetical protein
MIDALDFHGVLPEIAGVPDRTTPQISSNGEEPQPSSPVGPIPPHAVGDFSIRIEQRASLYHN